MQVLISGITGLLSKTGASLLRFNVTFVYPAEPEELRLTVKGCLAGRGKDGLWVQPPSVQKPGWSWPNPDWNLATNKLLLATFGETKDRNLKRAVRDLGAAPKLTISTQEFKEISLSL